MNGLKIFLAWGLTVVAGSLLPIVYGIFFTFNATDVLEMGAGFVILFMIISAICSLPTLIVLLVVNAANDHKGFKTCTKRVTMAHIIMILLTIGVERFFTQSTEIFSAFTLIVLYFAGVAAVIWTCIFTKPWKSATANEKWLALQSDPGEDSDDILKFD